MKTIVPRQYVIDWAICRNMTYSEVVAKPAIVLKMLADFKAITDKAPANIERRPWRLSPPAIARSAFLKMSKGLNYWASKRLTRPRASFKAPRKRWVPPPPPPSNAEEKRALWLKRGLCAESAAIMAGLKRANESPHFPSAPSVKLSDESYWSIYGY